MKIIKQELQFKKCLKQRIEFICEFSKVTQYRPEFKRLKGDIFANLCKIC